MFIIKYYHSLVQEEDEKREKCSILFDSGIGNYTVTVERWAAIHFSHESFVGIRVVTFVECAYVWYVAVSKLQHLQPKLYQSNL